MAVDVAAIETVYNKYMDTTTGSEGLVLKSIQEEYQAGRITGTDYATVYLGAIQTAMQLAVNSVQQQEQIDVEANKADLEQKATIAATEDQYGKVISLTNDNQDSTDTNTQHYQTVEKLKHEVNTAEKEIAVKDAEINSKIAQEELYYRQAEGFDDNKKQKAIDKALDTWAISFSALPDAATIPTNINSATDGIWYHAAEELKAIYTS